MDPRKMVGIVEQNDDGDGGDVFNEIMHNIAIMPDHDPPKHRYQVKRCTAGWFVEDQDDQKFFECWREYICVKNVCDMSYFVGGEFASLIKENKTTPLKKLPAKSARRIVEEILKFRSRNSGIKSARKR